MRKSPGWTKWRRVTGGGGGQLDGNSTMGRENGDFVGFCESSDTRVSQAMMEKLVNRGNRGVYAKGLERKMINGWQRGRTLKVTTTETNRGHDSMPEKVMGIKSTRLPLKLTRGAGTKARFASRYKPVCSTQKVTRG